MEALKWDEDAEKYNEVEISDGASLFELDMNTYVECANCERVLNFGACYTSRVYLNKVGLGYAVCPACYYKEQ